MIREKTIELAGLVRAAVGTESPVAVWEAAVDRLLADAKTARAAGQFALADRAERAATDLYLAKAEYFEQWRATPTGECLEEKKGVSCGISAFSRRSAKGARSAAFPPGRPYRKPFAPYLTPVDVRMIIGPSGKQLAARAAFKARFATAK